MTAFVTLPVEEEEQMPSCYSLERCVIVVTKCVVHEDVLLFLMGI